MSKPDSVSPFLATKLGHSEVEATEGSKDQEHVDIGSGVVDGGGDVRDQDIAVSAGDDVDLVVTGT